MIPQPIILEPNLETFVIAPQPVNLQGEAVKAVRAATAKETRLRTALPFGFLSAYTTRKKTVSDMREMAATLVAREFEAFDERLRLRRADYAKVWSHFEV